MQHFFSPNADLCAARRWLMLGVAALTIAGLFSIVLVVARTPVLSELAFFERLFHAALVAHVDLSVLAWFLCIAAMAWQLYAFPSKWNSISLGLMGIGAALITLAPFASGEVFKSNYIPVIANSPFLAGLSFVALASLMTAMHVIFFTRRPHRSDYSQHAAFQWAARGAALLVLVAIVAFLFPLDRIPDVIEGEQYFEFLFWAGGHILQFAWAQLLMLAWAIMLLSLYPGFPLTGKILIATFTLNVAIGGIGLAGLFFDVYSMEYREFYTNHMIMGGGVAPLLLLAVLLARWNLRGALQNDLRYLRPALYMSVLLFLYGGALGFSISGQDVTIPAHYHGAIVAVTIALMGLAYTLLPALGYTAPLPKKLIFWQPLIYGSGQLLHISGLAWSGGYGVLRKTPGALESGVTGAKVAMGVMGLGGLLAIIGGLLFVYIMAVVMLRQRA